ncbi:maltotransferase domain-containing protein, partial [Streptomyces sp. NPDC002754]
MTTLSNPAVPVPVPVSVPIPIEDVKPSVDAGRRPAKAVVGECFPVTALIFVEGDGVLGAEVVLRTPDGAEVSRWPMTLLAPGTDRWGAEVSAESPGRLSYCVRAWRDPVGTWMRDAAIKVGAGVDCEITLEEGAVLLERALARDAVDETRAVLSAAVDALSDADLSPLDRLAAATAPVVCAALEDVPLLERLSESRSFPLLVERERALFGSWYEFFPRSEGAVVKPGVRPVSGTFRTAARRLPAIAAMGFDVVYLPPVHPIGSTFRKGPNNSLSPGPDDVGVPWAIGSHEGGHDALHPDLGTFEDFDHFVGRARELGMEVALDFALQCSPDHPWVQKHPDWFQHRADGTIAYA